MLASCTKEMNPKVDKPMTTYSATHDADGEPTILGSQYTIPFRVSEMLAAKNSLERQKITAPHNFTVHATHLYVKFTPKNYQELDILEADSNLDITGVPKDYTIKQQGSWYRAPNLPDSVPNPQYASVSVNYTFPAGVNYQILDSLYVPDEDPVLMTTTPGKAEYWYADKLIAESHLLNPNQDVHQYFEMPSPYDDYDFGSGGGGSTTPHGIIRVWDNRLNQYVPLEGVKVESRRHWWSVTSRQGYTNANGEYYLSGSQNGGNSNYKIEFWRNGFKVNENSIDRFEIRENNKNRNSFSLDIENGSYKQFCATIFRAAYFYYYKDIDGLKSPMRTGAFDPDQRIIAKDEYKENWDGINWVAFPIIKITRYNNEAETDPHYSDEVYGITIHELAHTAHVLTMNNVIDFYNVNNQIVESWATAVQWYLTNKEYRARGIANYGNETYYVPDLRRPHLYAYQYWEMSDDPEYTSLFINLADNFNEMNVLFDYYGFGSVNDQVAGYNLSNIQSQFLKNCYAKSSLTTYLKAYKPTGVSNTQIDLLLSYY